jgi:LysR family transcriptional activator of nhaA
MALAWPAVLNFNHLYYFHVVASEGSVRAAAERLGVTQPTVSEQLRILERSLGVELFERTPSGLKLTQAGQEAFQHTTTMFVAGDRLAEALGQRGAAPEVVLRVGVSAGTARTLAADFLMPVLMVDGCRPSIRTGDFHDLLRGMRANELDVVIGEAEPADVGRVGLAVELVHRPLLVAIGTPDLEPDPDWKNIRLIEYRATSVYHWEVESYLQANNLRPTIVGDVDDAFLMLESVVRGGFVAFVPRSVAREALGTQRVKTLGQLTPTTAGVFAIYPAKNTLALARTAVERLIENARLHFAGF